MGNYLAVDKILTKNRKNSRELAAKYIFDNNWGQVRFVDGRRIDDIDSMERYTQRIY
jgi:hypothetical protein